jgi:hypothetical protein
MLVLAVLVGILVMEVLLLLHQFMEITQVVV